VAPALRARRAAAQRAAAAGGERRRAGAQVQFLDREHLLFSMGPGDHALLRSSSDISAQARPASPRRPSPAPRPAWRGPSGEPGLQSAGPKKGGRAGLEAGPSALRDACRDAAARPPSAARRRAAHAQARQRRARPDPTGRRPRGQPPARHGRGRRRGLRARRPVPRAPAPLGNCSGWVGNTNPAAPRAHAQAYFLVVYARGAGRVVDLHDNRSAGLAALYLRWPALFHAGCGQAPWHAFATPLPAAAAARGAAELHAQPPRPQAQARSGCRSS